MRPKVRKHRLKRNARLSASRCRESIEPNIPKDRSRSSMLKRFIVILLASVVLLSGLNMRAKEREPLVFVRTIPLSDLHDGDFDHLAVDIPGHRLFVAAEENSAVEVIDLRTDKLIHSIEGVKAPHSLLYRADATRWL